MPTVPKGFSIVAALPELSIYIYVFRSSKEYRKEEKWARLHQPSSSSSSLPVIDLQGPTGFFFPQLARDIKSRNYLKRKKKFSTPILTLLNSKKVVACCKGQRWVTFEQITEDAKTKYRKTNPIQKEARFMARSSRYEKAKCRNPIEKPKIAKSEGENESPEKKC